MTPRQTLLLWCLLGRGGQALQKDIAPKVHKSDRDALVAGGYLKCTRGKNRAITISVEDKGWRWAGEHLSDPLPKNYKVLWDWLSVLQRKLAHSGQSLAEFVSPTPPVTEAAPNLSAHELRARIEKAYLAVTGGRKAETAPLARVRAELTDLDRAAVDEGLRRILQGDQAGDKKARLSQLADPKALTQEDLDAAYSPAGEPFHLLWIKP